MTEGVLTVSTETTVAEAAARLVDADVNSLVVVDDANEPRGMFTTTDLAEIVAAGVDGETTTVAEHMTEDLILAEEGETVREAAAKMITHGIHHLPVADDGSVIGMLSSLDHTAYVSYTEGRDTE